MIRKFYRTMDMYLTSPRVWSRPYRIVMANFFYILFPLWFVTWPIAFAFTIVIAIFCKIQDYIDDIRDGRVYFTDENDENDYF